MKKNLAKNSKKNKNAHATSDPEAAAWIKALQGEVQRYKKLSQSKEEFIRMTNHELRTPLDVIRGNLDMVLKGETGDVSKQTREYLGDALMGADRLTKIVNDMLDISRIESGRVKFALKDLDITDILKATRTDFTQITKDKKIALYLDIKKNLPKVFSDSAKIYQILNDFLGNSLKFTPPGGSITLQAYPERETVVIAVKDTGLGIRREDQKKLFKRFPQIDTSALQGIKGTGLGLYLVKQFADMLGGEVWAESRGLGKGSKFFVRLPQSGTTKARLLAHSHAASSEQK